ncbi:MAG: bifunctional DNA primase/polymerase, partial [Pseudomonadales bacterium]|nr:bifunctional DNA primase/polymerase [Pseudomonadales bacterium]
MMKVNQSSCNTHEWALRYADIGYHIFPIHSIKNGKCTCGIKTCTTPGMHTRIKDWQQAATTSPTTIQKWFEQWPDSSIASTTGKQSNLFCISIDEPEGLQYAIDMEAIVQNLGNPAIATYHNCKTSCTYKQNL